MIGEELSYGYCPYCGEKVSLIVETFYQNLEYIEDCEVCCRPIQIKISSHEGELSDLSLKRLDD